MPKKNPELLNDLTKGLINIVSETNGISLYDTLELLCHSYEAQQQSKLLKLTYEFRDLIHGFQVDEVDIDTILNHPMSHAFFRFFKAFPLPYREEHIHLTGSLSAEFIYPRLKKLLDGPHASIYEKKIKEVYGDQAWPIESVEDVDQLIRLKDGEQFKTYLNILYLGKLVLTNRQAHREAAYHMASELYQQFNVGLIRLKFTLSRVSGIESEQVPGADSVSEEDVVLGLYQGFKDFQAEVPEFKFILAPSFRKELKFFDNVNFNSKKDHFDHQVEQIIGLLNRYPELSECLNEVDTVGDEKELYRKAHFNELKSGFRKLQYYGFKIRSHHGETWKNLRKGIQSVDNAMNIWHIDTLEHGLSLGINPNFYFHRLYQKIMEMNRAGQALAPLSEEYAEIDDMDWADLQVKDKLLRGEKLTPDEEVSFLKTKFHTAREIEHYQHDVLNRMINKSVSLVSLPSSNLKLTGFLPYYKDHPFSWWEKKGVRLGVGTDNYITLNTNFIQEMLILLYSDPENLKITKLLMITTGEARRAYISKLLWEMRRFFTEGEESESP
jgi:adenosine deaminase